jgi:phosphoribosyl 1,2-cyclic phosphate phosphodiesterase
VPTLGGADGRGDWGACDPVEPRNRRSRSGIVIHAPAGAILVDTGPDLRSQILACGIPHVNGIIFTHSHADHITGLDDVRLLNRLVGAPLPGFAMPETASELRRRFDYAFRPWKPPGFFRPVIELAEIAPGCPVELCGARVLTFAQDHHVMRTLGLRVGAFGYSTDVVRLDDSAFAALAGVDTWLVGCFQRLPHLTHAHLDLVLEWRKRLRPRRTVLTHMGIDMDWDWLHRNLPSGVEAASDGMTIEVKA